MVMNGKVVAGQVHPLSKKKKRRQVMNGDDDGKVVAGQVHRLSKEEEEEVMNDGDDDKVMVEVMKMMACPVKYRSWRIYERVSNRRIEWIW